MRLGRFIRDEFHDFDNYKEIEIEDVGFLQTMINRLIEDTELVAFAVAKGTDREIIDDEVLSSALRLIDSESAETVGDAPESAIVSFQMVRDFARAPLMHSDEAISLLARFANFHLINMLKHAAQKAEEDGTKTIKLRHYLPWCEDWPYPLNRYC